MNPVVHVRRVPELEPDHVESAVDSLFDALDALDGDLGDAERVLIVPDTHHPYHPSTGTVTNPAVLDALLGRFRAAGCAVRVGVTDAEAARCLGVDAVADSRGVEVLALADAGCETRTVSSGGEERRVSVPEPLLRDAVVALPTLRRDEDGAGIHLAGVGARCARAVGAGDGNDVSRHLATAAVSPVAALLDATYTPGETPRESRGLLASTDAAALDAVAADLLGVSLADVRRAPEPTVRGASLASLRGDVADGVPPEAEPSPVMGAAYRLYARLVGDAIPPQFQRSAANGDGGEGGGGE